MVLVSAVASVACSVNHAAGSAFPFSSVVAAALVAS